MMSGWYEKLELSVIFNLLIKGNVSHFVKSSAQFFLQPLLYILRIALSLSFSVSFLYP